MSGQVSQIRQLIESGLSDAQIEGALAAQSKRPAIFREDGTLHGISYQKACPPRRGAALCLSIGRKKGQKVGLTNSLMVDGYDFFEVYRKAVQALAEYHGVADQSELVAEMHNTAELFLKTKRLMTKRVEIVFQQVVCCEQD